MICVCKKTDLSSWKLKKSTVEMCCFKTDLKLNPLIPPERDFPKEDQ